MPSFSLSNLVVIAALLAAPLVHADAPPRATPVIPLCPYASVGFNEEIREMFGPSPDATIVAEALKAALEAPPHPSYEKSVKDYPLERNEFCALMRSRGIRQMTVSCSGSTQKYNACEDTELGSSKICGIPPIERVEATCMVAKYPPPGKPVYANFLLNSVGTPGFAQLVIQDPKKALKVREIRVKLYTEAIFQAISSAVSDDRNDRLKERSFSESDSRKNPGGELTSSCFASPTTFPLDLEAFNEVIRPQNHFIPGNIVN